MRVMIAIDQSQYSSAALETISRRPWPKDTEILILSVVDLDREDQQGWYAEEVPDLSPFKQALVDSCRTYVDEKVEELGKKLPEAIIKGRVLQGDVKETIVEESFLWKADFLVMGSHGRTGLERLFLGSVAESVLNRVKCVVEIVKSPALAVESKERAKAGSLMQPTGPQFAD